MTGPLHFPLDLLAADLRAAGNTVTVRPNAQGKSAHLFENTGYYMGCQASVAHHTASTGLYPDNDIAYLDGGKRDGYIIANAYTARDGHITLIASGPTYTEGSSEGPYGIIPQSRGNDVCFSNEIGGGLGEPYPAAQTSAALDLHVCVNHIAAEVWEWPDDPFSWMRAFAHYEYTTRKIDPKGDSPWADGYDEWDMDSFRFDAKARHAEIYTPAPVPPPSGDDPMILIQPAAAHFRGGLFTVEGQPVSPELLNALGAKAEIMQQDHPHWDAATWDKMGSEARRLYITG